MVTLVGVVVPKRIATYQQAGEFRSSVINAELDRAVAVMEQLLDGQARRLALHETDPAAFAALPVVADRAGRYLSFDAEGQPIAAAIVGGVAVTPYGETLLDDTDAATAARLAALRGRGAAALEDVQATGTGDLLREDGDGSSLTGVALGMTPRHHRLGDFQQRHRPAPTPTSRPGWARDDLDRRPRSWARGHQRPTRAWRPADFDAGGPIPALGRRSWDAVPDRRRHRHGSTRSVRPRRDPRPRRLHVLTTADAADGSPTAPGR